MPIFKNLPHQAHFYILPLIFLMITLYFTYHLIQGERGLFRLFEINQELVEAQNIESSTGLEKEQLEQKVHSLSANSIDADMLDEEARQNLGFINPNEFIIFEK